jgi:hypothetical protein
LIEHANPSPVGKTLRRFCEGIGSTAR